MNDLTMEIIKRDDSTFQLNFLDENNNPVDLTGGTVFFTVKKKKTDVDADAVIAKEITVFDNPTAGIAILEIDNSESDLETRMYWFDVQLKDTLGKISSSGAGRFIVTQDITIRTS